MTGESEARYRALLQAVPEPLLAVDLGGRVMEINGAMERLLGRAREELLGTDFSRLFESPERARQGLETVLSEGSLREFPARLLGRDGNAIPALFNGSVLLDAEGNLTGAIGSARDITELAEARAELERSHRRLRAHLANSPVGVIEWDGELRITGWSKGAERIFGWTADEAVGSVIGRDLALVHEDDEQEVDEVLGRLLSGEEQIGVKNYNYRKDGAVICCEWYNSVLHDEGEGSVMSIALDVTRKESLEEELRSMADRDPLTDLPNRRVFDRRIAAMMEQDEVSPRGNTAILYLDLDGFKAVNDRYGHEVGDELLRAVGRRLSAVLRSGDSLARLGGDEFAAIIEELPEGPDGEREADHVASRLLNAVETPFLVAGREISISASLGVAVGDRDRAAELLRASDARMYGLKSKSASEQSRERGRS